MMQDQSSQQQPSQDRLAGDAYDVGAETAKVAAELRTFGQKLDRFLDTADQSVALGRELVEQRAENLDLKRQISRLEEEVRFLKAGAGTFDPSANGSVRDLSVDRDGKGDRRNRGLGAWVRRLLGHR